MKKPSGWGSVIVLLQAPLVLVMLKRMATSIPEFPVSVTSLTLEGMPVVVLSLPFAHYTGLYSDFAIGLDFYKTSPKPD